MAHTNSAPGAGGVYTVNGSGCSDNGKGDICTFLVIFIIITEIKIYNSEEKYGCSL